jgi:hypothetical protein
MVRDPKFRPELPLTSDPKFIGGARAQSQDTDFAHSLLWMGRILHVDSETMVCSIQLESGTGERFDVPIPAPGGCGPRSWSGNLPERHSKVVIGWRRYSNRAFAPYIVQFVTVGVYPSREFEPFSTVDPSDAEEVRRTLPELANDPHINLDVIRLKSRKGYAGDWIASSSSGADSLMDRNIHMMNRAGNEYLLRDSDQTAILQTINEFTSNSAGYYRRGLIRRNSFNFLPDLAISGFNPITDDFDVKIENKFITNTDESGTDLRSMVTKIDIGSPAYQKLLEFGLINQDGTPIEAVGIDPDNLLYPFSILPDGQRTSHIVMGESDLSFTDTDQCYVEDRMELRHTHDGVMAVTEDGDGVQIDLIPPLYIEDVHGTVVGNDAYTESGRALYKKILTMRVFDDPDQGSNSPAPIFEPVDIITSQIEADTKALARLFRIQSPTSSNQFAFGITKEGRVFLHVPKSQSTTPQDKGKSIDANILGLIKAIIGIDENTQTSLDIRTLGGVKLDIGSFQDRSNSDDPQSVSVDLILRGKIKTTYAGTHGRETTIGGSDYTGVSGSKIDIIGGNIVRSVGGLEAVEAFSITHNIGFGGYKHKVAGDANRTTLGKTTELYGQLRQSTFALNDTKLMLAGVDSTTVLAGGIARTVVAGTGIADTVTAGNIAMTAAAGNIAATVGTGNFAATVGAGNLSLMASAGTATMLGGASATMASSGVANIAAPVTKIGLISIGFAVAGAPGPPSIARDYVTGLPLLGIPTISIG